MKSLIKFAWGVFFALAIASCSTQDENEIFQEAEKNTMVGEHDYCRKNCE